MTEHTATLSREALAAWPKAELHCHLDGSPRLASMLQWAEEQDKMALLPADTLDGLRARLRAVDDSDTLEAYLAWFRYSIPLMQSHEVLEQAACELAEDAARENVRYLEVRFAPILHTEEGMTMEEVCEAVLDGLARARRDHGIRTGLIICGLRDRYESASLAQAEVAVRMRRRGVVAFDLAGGEAGNPSKQHLGAFYHARNGLLSLTCHAGEAWGPDAIQQALFFCGVHRVGHGVSLYEDTELLQYVVDHQIPLEVCPTSNVQTKVVKSWAEHPVTAYMLAGVPVTINTDNRLFSRTTMTEELYRVHTRCGAPAELIREAVLNGFRHAFLPWDEKQALLQEVKEQIVLPAEAARPSQA